MLSLIQMVKNVVTLSFTEKYKKGNLDYEFKFRQKEKLFVVWNYEKEGET